MLNTRIIAVKNSAGLVEKEKELGLNLEKISRETITVKENKLLRDQKAFFADKAYNWPNSQPFKVYKRSRNNFTHNHSNIELDGSDSSASSVSSHVSSFPYRNFKQNKKRPNEYQQDQTSEFKRRTDNRHMGDR